MANKGRKEKEDKDKDIIKYYGIWKSVQRYDYEEDKDSEKINFQTNHGILCRESFDSPTLLILKNLSELQIYEHSLETNIIKSYELDNSVKKIKKPAAYFGITEEINYSIFVFGGLYFNKRNQIEFTDKLYRISLKNKTILEVEIKNGEKEETPSARCGSTLNYVSFPFPHLLLFGGVTDEGKFSNELWCFNILQLRWDKVKTTGFIPPPMELHSTLIWNKSLIIVGGLIKENDVYETSDYIYWLDLERAVWHRVSGNKKINRANHSMQAYQDELIIYGGFRTNSVENKFNNETPIKSNYTKFHKDVLIESEILNDINVIHLTSLEVDDIYFDNDVPGIKMLPLSGTSSFINRNVFGIFGGVNIKKDKNELEENLCYYTCEIGAPPSPYHVIPYNINCSSFDLVWKETCDMNSKFYMKRTYSIEIARLSNDTDLTAIDGMQPIYLGEKTKCHVNKVIFGNKFVTPLYPDTNYRIRTYSFTKFNDFERMAFPEAIVKTAPCDIIRLPNPCYYFFEKENLFIFDWINENKNKYPCIHTKYYFSALPLYMENSKNSKPTLKTDLNSTILYIGLKREISFTMDQLLKILSEECKGYETIKDKSKCYILFRIEQYNLVRDQVALFDSKQVMVVLSDNKFEKFIGENEINSFLDEFEIINFIDKDDENQSETEAKRTRSTRATRSRIRNKYPMRRKRAKSDNASDNGSSNTEDKELKFNFITDIASSKRTKKFYKNSGAMFSLKLFINSTLIDLKYEYYDKDTIEKNKKPLSIKMENNVIYNEKTIYTKLNNYFENTSEDSSKKEKVVFSRNETEKYNTYYSKENIKKFKEAFFETINIKRRKNYSRESIGDPEKKSWELNRIPPKYICFGTINSSLCLNTLNNELYFTGNINLEKRQLQKFLTDNERRAIFTFMKYNKEYIFKTYSPYINETLKNEENFESDDSVRSIRSLRSERSSSLKPFKRRNHERTYSWNERSSSKYYKSSKGERLSKLGHYSESEDSSKSDESLKNEPTSISYPDSLSSFISKTSNTININDILSKIENDNDNKFIKFAFLDKNKMKYIICINDQKKFKPNDVSLFII